MFDNKYFDPSGAPAIPKAEEPVTPVDQLPRFINTKDTGDKIFLVVNGKAHWITNPDSLKAVGGDFGTVKQINRASFGQLENGEEITIQNAVNYKQSEAPKFETYDAPLVPPGAVEASPIEVVPGFTSIIIPAAILSYPLFHYTGHCIGNVRTYTDQSRTPYEIILVLNGPSVIPFPNLEETHADKVIQLPENVGYGAAMNRGIRVAKGEYVVLLSNDVLVFDKWLDNFIWCLEFKDLVMSHPMYGMPFARQVEANNLRLKWEGKQFEETFSDFRDFSCVAARKSLFDKIGMFDEKFFVYKEDLDIMNRMDKEKLTYASTGLINTFHPISSTGIYVSKEQKHEDEGAAYYKEKWG